MLRVATTRLLPTPGVVGRRQPHLVGSRLGEAVLGLDAGGGGAVAEVPSKPVIAPSGSVDPEASNSTSAPAAMRSGASIIGTGGAFTVTMRRVSIDRSPRWPPAGAARG